MDKIETKRLLLRKVNIADANDMFNNWASDPEVCTYMTRNAHANIDVTKARINKWIEDVEGNKYRFIITLKDDKTPIGTIDVVNIEDNIAEIGYCSGKRWWDNGYMTEACKAFIEYLFNLGFNEIVIEAHVDNIGSNRVIQKCGFKFTHKETRPISEIRPELVTVNWYKITK